MAGLGAVKPEGGFSSGVKLEGDINMASPAASDIYEDDHGDLDLSQYNPNIFLARLPRYLWKSWDSLGDDDEIEIGTLRVEGSPTNPSQISLKLHSALKAHEKIPKEFVLNITNDKPPNTFVFTEEDLPGFNSRLKMSGKAGDDTNLPMSKAVPMGMRSQKPKTEPGKVDKTRRFQNFRRAIPKKTVLIGRVHQELNCLPVENAEYQRIMLLRNAEEHKVVAPTATEGNLAAMLGGGHRTVVDNFIRQAPVKGKMQQNKNVRMAQNDLFDAMFACFREFKYWRLKDLRIRLQQPEAYVKQGLQTIGAHLVQSGSKVGTYALGEDAQKLLHLADGEAPLDDEAPDQAGDDGDVKME